MSERPMHSIPGAFQKLQELYAAGVDATENGDFEAAVAHFNEGLAIDDHFRHMYVTMYARRGYALLNLKRWQQAIADFDKALEMEPDFTHQGYLQNRATCRHRGFNDLAGAKADLDAALQKGEGPGTWALYMQRGNIRLELGDKMGAASDYQNAFDRNDNVHTREAVQKVQQLRIEAAQEGQAAAESGAGDADPEVFPGSLLPRLSDYVDVMRKMQKGDMQGALGARGIDMLSFGTLAAQWGQALAADPTLNAKFSKLMSS